MTEETTILIIAPPGTLRDSLQILLAALPGNRSVIVTSGWLVESLRRNNHHPVLVLLVLEPGSSGAEVREVIAYIKTHWSQAALVVLVDTESQRQAVTSAGADRVWYKGTLAAQMLFEIEGLLNRS
jgi:hypothetical protein